MAVNFASLNDGASIWYLNCNAIVSIVKDKDYDGNEVVRLSTAAGGYSFPATPENLDALSSATGVRISQ